MKSSNEDGEPAPTNATRTNVATNRIPITLASRESYGIMQIAVCRTLDDAAGREKCSFISQISRVNFLVSHELV
jgi:hypothetical protein